MFTAETQRALRRQKIIHRKDARDAKVIFSNGSPDRSE
jgi:hypothetical protein